MHFSTSGCFLNERRATYLALSQISEIEISVYGGSEHTRHSWSHEPQYKLQAANESCSVIEESAWQELVAAVGSAINDPITSLKGFLDKHQI